jgi:hypothetical protein
MPRSMNVFPSTFDLKQSYLKNDLIIWRLIYPKFREKGVETPSQRKGQVRRHPKQYTL